MAQMTFSMTVGAVTVSETLDISDARGLEFLDLLRNFRYSKDGVNVPTRQQAAARFAVEMKLQVQTAYRQLKEAEDRTSRNSRPNYDITA